MALDFHRADTNEYLFGINDSQYANMEEVLQTFKKQTGIIIDMYSDAKLAVKNQMEIIEIINLYSKKTDLNVSKQKTIDILEFRALLKYFSGKKYDLITFCD